MSNEAKNHERDLAEMHLFYLGGLLVEGMKNFHNDILINHRYASEIFGRPTYLRMIELRDKFEQAALLKAG